METRPSVPPEQIQTVEPPSTSTSALPLSAPTKAPKDVSLPYGTTVWHTKRIVYASLIIAIVTIVLIIIIWSLIYTGHTHYKRVQGNQGPQGDTGAPGNPGVPGIGPSGSPGSPGSPPPNVGLPAPFSTFQNGIINIPTTFSNQQDFVITFPSSIPTNQAGKNQAFISTSTLVNNVPSRAFATTIYFTPSDIVNNATLGCHGIITSAFNVSQTGWSDQVQIVWWAAVLPWIPLWIRIRIYRSGS